jgi:hypothetical protein
VACWRADAACGELSRPVAPRSLLALLATLEPIDEELPPVIDLPIDDVEL